ncbi:S-layer homology domain-containing protein [Citricoccus sp. GCM10030269]|uniref:S-layer homology domain-containing protein n=1 Tax=Citricoccus sp. GCM10030269 TaxID=3273388 RepID=UPI00361C7F58
MSTIPRRAFPARSSRRLTAGVMVATTLAVATLGSLGGLSTSLVTATSAVAADSCGKADFVDNPTGSGHYAPITWMNCREISVGYPDNTFRKNRQVTRGEIAAFLYRQVRPSHPSNGQRYFTDVNPGGAYYDAITWFAQKGISVGYSDHSFRPGQAVTRGELAAFLHRLAGNPQAAAGSFADMGSGTDYYSAASWLLSAGITSGYGDGTFKPRANISRAETAAFLYKANGSIAGRGNVTTPVAKPLPADSGTSPVTAWKTKAAQWAKTKATSSSTYYQYGGTGPNGFDCSGFTSGAFQAGGKSLPRTSSSQYGAADQHVPVSQAQVGDLVYWSNNGSSSGVYHVAIVVDEGTIAHARNPSSGVTLTDIDYSPYNMLGMAGRFD